MNESRKGWGLLRQKPCWRLTARGWLAAASGGVLLLVIAVRTIHPFLAVNDPRRGGILVVEGWAPDYVMQAALAEFGSNRYERLVVTGGPIEVGSYLLEYKTFADVGTATLLKLGAARETVASVPAPKVQKDRTYTSAVALRRWLAKQGITTANFHVISHDAHARRTRLLYEKALGSRAHVGITAVPDEDYDVEHWWTSSAGVRTVLSEAIAYAYARVFFRTPKEAATPLEDVGKR